MLSAYSQLQHLYVNASAAKRILGIPASRRIEFSDITADSVTVTHAHRGEQHTVTLTVAQFEQEFIRYRQEGAKECIAQPHNRGQWGETFTVTGSSGDRYYVEAGDDHLACTCEDWHQHETVCKHGWAVLNLLGLTSFEQYQQARSKVVYIHQPQRVKGRLCVNGVGIE